MDTWYNKQLFMVPAKSTALLLTFLFFIFTADMTN